jgi:hypothetical protein
MQLKGLSHFTNYALAPPLELDSEELEKAWNLRLPTNSELRHLLMRMVKSKPEERVPIHDVLEDAYFGTE